VLDAEHGLRRGHLAATEARHVTGGHGTGARIQVLVEDVAALAPGATHDQDLVTASGVRGVGAGSLARLVVGMGVDRHEAAGRACGIHSFVS
jgi:hypothetical protein